MEKHIRKNKLTAGTFSDQVGASASLADHESTDREARKLAFFLYWNIKPTFARCRDPAFTCMALYRAVVLVQFVESAGPCWAMSWSAVNTAAMQTALQLNQQIGQIVRGLKEPLLHSVSRVCGVFVQLRQYRLSAEV